MIDPKKLTLVKSFDELRAGMRVAVICDWCDGRLEVGFLGGRYVGPSFLPDGSESSSDADGIMFITGDCTFRIEGEELEDFIDAGCVAEGAVFRFIEDADNYEKDVAEQRRWTQPVGSLSIPVLPGVTFRIER
jgi:hypothetical protein